MRQGPIVLSVLLIPTLCCKPRSEPRPATPDPPPSTRRATKPDPCTSIIDAYTRELAKATLGCRADTDCGCYSGGVGPRAGCGGVVNRETLLRLQALWERFRAAGCRYTQHCAPRTCIPRCHEGQCVEASLG